jgi:hypothetical protein
VAWKLEPPALLLQLQAVGVRQDKIHLNDGRLPASENLFEATQFVHRLDDKPQLFASILSASAKKVGQRLQLVGVPVASAEPRWPTSF